MALSGVALLLVANSFVIAWAVSFQRGLSRAASSSRKVGGFKMDHDFGS